MPGGLVPMRVTAPRQPRAISRNPAPGGLACTAACEALHGRRLSTACQRRAAAGVFAPHEPPCPRMQRDGRAIVSSRTAAGWPGRSLDTTLAALADPSLAASPSRWLDTLPSWSEAVGGADHQEPSSIDVPR